MSKLKSTAKANFEKTSSYEALLIANDLCARIDKYCAKYDIAGSIRQGKDMVGDVDIVVLPNISLLEFIDKVKDIIEYEYGGNKKIFGMYLGRPVNIFITTQDSYGACLYQSTGPAMYNVHKRRMAKAKGYKLNEYGLFNRDTDEKVAGETERSIFDFLGWSYKEPSDRKSPTWVK